MPDPMWSEGWLALSIRRQRPAELAADDKIAAAGSLFHVGSALECALKAYIMKKERLNGWPSRETRPELYTHDPRELCRIAGLKFGPSHQAAAAWAIVRVWDRDQDYDPARMSRKVARSWCEAAFGHKGVVTWIRATLT